MVPLSHCLASAQGEAYGGGARAAYGDAADERARAAVQVDAGLGSASSAIVMQPLLVAVDGWPH